jgi:hypothetical protein
MAENTMTVRLTTGMVSADAAHGPGDEITIDTKTAKRLLESGQAEPVVQRRVAKAEKRDPAPAEVR